MALVRNWCEVYGRLFLYVRAGWLRLCCAPAFLAPLFSVPVLGALLLLTGTAGISQAAEDLGRGSPAQTESSGALIPVQAIDEAINATASVPAIELTNGKLPDGPGLSSQGTQAKQAEKTHFIITQVVSGPLADQAINMLEAAYSKLGYTIEFELLQSEFALQKSNKGLADGEMLRVVGIEKNYPNLIPVPVPYLVAENVLFASEDWSKEVKEWDDLIPIAKGEKIIGLRAGLKKAEQQLNSRNISYTGTQTTEEAMEMLSQGRIKLVYEERRTGLEVIKRLGLKNIKVLEPPLDSVGLYHYVHKRNHLLVPKLNKAFRELLVGIPKKIKKQLTFTPEQKAWLAIGIILVFALLLLSTLALPRLISDEDLANHFGSTRFRYVALIVISLMIVLVSGLVWSALDYNKTSTLNTIRDDLKVIHLTTNERLDAWIRERNNFLLRLGRDPKLVDITKRLLKVRPDAELLKGSLPLSEAREFFEANESEFGKIGFFIINPSYISIGSKRDSNLGMMNLIAKKRPELLARAFEGQAVFIPPIRSDVVIDDQNGASSSEAKKPLTMFFAVPIRDVAGSVLAVMTQRLRLQDRLSTIMKAGRIGQSGESYLLNRHGVLLTESRFKEQLFDIGLLTEGEKEYGRLEIRDPGGNMLKGFKPQSSQSELTMTRMAKDIIRISQDTALRDTNNGYSNLMIDVDSGYRDYRGIPVLGAWSWNNRLELGMASEINLDEAMGGYYSMRLSLLLITGITMLLASAAFLVTLFLGERATRAMIRARDELEIKVADRTKELQRYIDIVDKHVITSSMDLKGTITYASEAFSQISQYTKEDLLGGSYNILSHPDTSPEIYKNIWETIQGGKCWRGELKNRAKDGSDYWIEANIEPVFDLDRGIVGYTSIRQDITDKKRIEKLSVTDRLTGLYNRLKLDEAFAHELERARRYDRPLSVILFDIDHFKQVNDTFGHQVGDDVLVSIAELTMDSIRATDIAGRWGGEEFMVICPETDMTAARTAADKIRIAIEAHTFPEVGQKTASFGVSTVEPGEGADEMTQRADEALYRAKNKGRNCVE